MARRIRIQGALFPVIYAPRTTVEGSIARVMTTGGSRAVFKPRGGEWQFQKAPAAPGPMDGPGKPGPGDSP